MDVIEIAIEPEEVWKSRTVDLVNFYINGRNIIDIVRDVELPFDSLHAGHYIGILPDHFLEYYKRDVPGKTYLLQCDCFGTIGCNPLLARVVIEKDVVIWDAFEQPNWGEGSRGEHWTYNLKFVFDRTQYESEFKKIVDYVREHEMA
jgi:hypothetical protein